MMQRGANAADAEGPLPPGLVPLFEVQAALLRMVWAGSHNAKPSGKDPISIFAPDCASISIRRRLLDAVAETHANAGIADLLMENILDEALPKGKLVLWKDGEIHPLDDYRLLYLCDPCGPPPPYCWTRLSRHAFADFANNRRNGHPFLDRRTWQVLENPKFELAMCEDDVTAMAEIWSHLSNAAGAFVIYDARVGRKRVYPSASAIAEESRGDLQRMMAGDVPAQNTPQFAELSSRAVTYYRGLTDDLKHSLTKDILLGGLGLQPRERSRKVDALWKALCAALPAEDALRLLGRGRRTKRKPAPPQNAHPAETRILAP